MGSNLTQKILAKHGVDIKKAMVGQPIEVRVDRILASDGEGAENFALYFEALGAARHKDLQVLCCVDRTGLAARADHAEIHRFLQTFCARHRFFFSEAGNGHPAQVHADLFGAPGQVALGVGGGAVAWGGWSALAFTADPLDAARAAAKGVFTLSMPKAVQVRLSGVLPPWLSGRDVGLDMLKRLTVKGGSGRVFEYVGEGVRSLSAADRSSIAWFGAQFGAVASLFPSDDQTREHLAARHRRDQWTSLAPDPDAGYDEYLEVDLGLLEPLVAKPHGLDGVASIREVEGTRVNQVVIASDHGSFLRDACVAASVLKGRRVPPEVELLVVPGSRAALRALAAGGQLDVLLEAGARLAESVSGLADAACHLPGPQTVAVRTFGSNTKGAAGTPEAMLYYAGPEVAVASALKGALADPRVLGKPPRLDPLRLPDPDAAGIVKPVSDPARVEVFRGPSIRPLPAFDPLPSEWPAAVLLKSADDLPVDRILGRDERILDHRYNVPGAAQHALEHVDPMFVRRAMEAKSGIVLCGERYGIGASHPLAALVLRHLNVRAVVARGFGPEHLADLVRFGIVPLSFEERASYDKLVQGDAIRIPNFRKAVESGGPLAILVPARKLKIGVKLAIPPDAARIVAAGGVLAGASVGRAPAAPRKAARHAPARKTKAVKAKRR